MKSYAIDAFQERDEELSRLERQARMGWALERGMLERIGFGGSGTCLDLGCGSGQVSMLLAESFPGARVIGVEPSDALRHRARSVAGDRELSQRCTFVNGTAEAIPLPDGSVDLCLSRFVFQHLDDPVRALREIFRVLAPEGVVVIEDIDDRCVVVHEEPPDFGRFMVRSAGAQARLGGDRHVGRKLGSYLHRAGFERARTAIMPVSSDDIPLAALVEVFFGFRHEAMQAVDMFDQRDGDVMNELRGLPGVDGSWAAASVFFGHARKDR